MVFAAATDENLGLHLVRLLVFVWPASDRFFASQIVTSVVLTGPATDEILEPQIERFVVVAGLGHLNVRPGFSWRRALENSLSVALSTLLAGQPMYVLVYCAAVSGSEME